MFSHKQQGKSIFAFMAGSIVALGIMAIVLFMLNKNSERDFKQPELIQQNPINQQPMVETLTPNQMASPPAPVAQPILVENEHIPSDNDNAPVLVSPAPTPNSRPAATAPNMATAPQQRMPANTVQDDPVLGNATDNLAETPRTERKKTARANSNNNDNTNTRPTPKRTARENINDENIKPSAEQILNSGSIEKAREVARQEAREKRRAEREAAQTDAATNGKKRTIQAGAYNNRAAADAQRAKLALHGVQTHVVEAQAGGKTVYRVQTKTMDGRQAEKLRQDLKQNGIETFTR